MKHETYTEGKSYTSASFIDDVEFAPIAVAANAPVEAISSAPEAVFLESFLAGIKWVFLFVPGGAAIHIVFMGMALFLFYDGPNMEMVLGAVGLFVAGMFMVMLGIGRFTNLRYLRVVGGLSAASSIAAIAYALSATLVPGDFYGWFVLITLPMAIIIGQLVKKMIDRESLPHE